MNVSTTLFIIKKESFSPYQSMLKDFYKPSYFERVERGDDDDDDGAVLSINTQSPAPSQPSPAPSRPATVLLTETTKFFSCFCCSVVLDSLALIFIFLSSHSPRLHSHTPLYSVQQRATHTYTPSINSLLLTMNSQS